MAKGKPSLVINDTPDQNETLGVVAQKLDTVVPEAVTKKGKGEESDVHLCMYTDGGCRPSSRGVGGWGVHGYLFTMDPPKQGNGCKGMDLTAVGYLEEKEKGVPVTPIGYVDGCGSLIPESTNNIAELTAAIRTLQFGIERGVKSMHLILDSKYVLEGLTENMFGWKEKGWVRQDGESVKNVEFWQELYALDKQRRDMGIPMTTAWVKGHDGNFGNEIADAWASRAVMAGLNGFDYSFFEVTDAKGYWGRRVEVNRMFSHPYWYFNTNLDYTPKTEDGRYIYHLGDHGTEDDFLGKQNSDSSFSVLFTKEPEPVLSAIRGHQDNIDNTSYNSVVICGLNNVFKRENYLDFYEHGARFLEKQGPNFDLINHKKELITHDLKPPRIAFRVFTSLEIMEDILERFCRIADTNVDTKSPLVVDGHVVATDITDVLYEEVVSKKATTLKLKSVLGPSVSVLPVDVFFSGSDGIVEVPLKLTVGIDLPNRNTLTAVSDQKPRVFVVTWRESDCAIRYATIISTGDDVGIWGGIYSNIHVLKK